ncbi:MAG: tRNA (mnm(5)s(2)U34)-methyltransferase [Parachlamydiaceae bacterium]
MYQSRFQAHLELAHRYWEQHLQISDIVIDATCGNGHDTLKLCQLTLSDSKGHVFAFDVQEKAIETTKQRLQSALTPDQFSRVTLIQGCHSDFSQIHLPSSPRLIVYNLGYLPGADKAQTTHTSSTLQSVQTACQIIASGGLIVITCYPGHDEGAEEEKLLLAFASQLPRNKWHCCHHRWVNRERAPSLLVLQQRS